MLLKKRWFRRSIGLLLAIGVLVVGIRIITFDPNFREIDNYFSFAISPDRSLLATTSGDKITLWRLPALTVEREFSNPAKVEPRTIAWRPDGLALAVGSRDSSNTIVIYDLVANTVTPIAQSEKSFVHTLAWSPDGQWLAIGTQAQIELVQMPDGRSTHILSQRPVKLSSGSFNFLRSLIFDVTGETLISVSDDNIIRRWRVDDGILLDSFQAHEEGIACMALSPDGETLAIGAGNTVRLWNVDDGTLRDTFMRHKESVNSVTWSPDGQWVASGSGDLDSSFEPKDITVKVWQASDGGSLFTFGGQETPVDGVAFSADGQWLISGAPWDGLRRWKVK